MVCLDETSKQLLAETRVPIPMKPGRPARCDYEYADSDECGQAIQLNAATRSDRMRPPFPMKAAGLDCRHDDLGQGLLVPSRLEG